VRPASSTVRARSSARRGLPACQGIAHALRRPRTGHEVSCSQPPSPGTGVQPGQAVSIGSWVEVPDLAQPCDRCRRPWKEHLGVVEHELAPGLTRGHAVAEQLAWWCTARPEQEIGMSSKCLRAVCVAQARLPP
jgi:hypothetical protein